MAISLGRGIVKNDQLFRKGMERYGIAGNAQALSLYDAPVGFIGYGNLGRALGPLLAPFSCPIRIYDPWLSRGYLAREGYTAAPLEEVLQQSRYLFLLAGVHTENGGFLSRALLDRIDALVAELFPNAKRESSDWRVGGLDGEAGNSLSIGRTGDRRGLWKLVWNSA